MRYDNWHRESFDGCDLVGKSHHVVYIDFMCLFLLITISDPEGLVYLRDIVQCKILWACKVSQWTILDRMNEFLGISQADQFLS